jgi:hypothetical protein
MGGMLGALVGSFAPVGGSYESIATVTAAGGETSITFSSIPQTYASLQLRILVRRNSTNALTVGLRPNNETSASFYTQHSLIGNGSTVSATGTASGTYNQAINNTTMPGTTSGAFGAQIWDILDYASTTKNKTLRSFAGYDSNGNGEIGLVSNLFIKTDAITSLVVFFDGDTVTSNCVFSLYGIKG